MMRMTRDEQIAAVMASPIPICPCCEHGMDPHGVDPGGICGVGGCECLLAPSTIHWLLNRPSVTDDATQRLARAAFAVDGKHHFHEGQDGRPTCSCGFVGDARKRTQTEHITAAVIEEYDHD